MPIEQVYCTHCTYGTSALEQREGELADRVLGYSARAGSADRNELRNDYRAIERFLYYYLPSDTPPEEKQRLDAAGAPRRLFFCPSMGRLQMVGQVAYRQYDTAGRLGSYFAHVLFADRAVGGWSTVDCLRLWNAPWMQEDSPDHPFKLPSLERLDAVWAGRQPTIGDDALLQFLQTSTAPAGGDDAGILLEPRWQNVPAQQRIDLVANALQGLLALGTQRRESVLLVVEPGIAALVFYGVVRLLPPSLAADLSFSTYEPNAERLPVTLAATTFFDPQTADVRADLYRRRGLVINTYQDRVSEAGLPPGNYARFMVEQLLEEGWPAVDRLRETFEAAGAKRPEDLEVLVPTHRLVSQVLSASPPDDDSWRKSELAARYLAREVQYQLSTPPGNGFRLNRVVGTPNHLTVLELIACEPPVPGLQRPAQLLLKEFPPERIAELVASPLLARGAKLEALASYAGAQGRLPDGCQLLAEPGAGPKNRSSGGWLLPELLARLPDGVLRRVYDSLDEGQRGALLPALVAACKQASSSPAALKRLLLEILSRLSDEAFLDALVRYGRELGETYPPPEPALASRLGRALYELPDNSSDFETRLTVLDQWKGYFFYPNLAERRLGEWKRVRSCLLELGEREQKSAAGRLERIKQRLRPPRPPDFKPLGEALAHAMPRRTSELEELAQVTTVGGLDITQFKARLELASRHLGCPMVFEKEAVGTDSQTPKNGPAGGPQAELERLRRWREQQIRMMQLQRELEERLWIYGDDPTGKRKLQVLQRIAQTLLGRSPLTLAGKQQIELYFETGLWPTPGALSTGKGKRRFKLKHPSKPSKQPSWTNVAVVGLVIAVLVPLVGYLFFGGRSSRVATNQTTSRPPAKQDVKETQPEPVETAASDGVANQPGDTSSSLAEPEEEEEAPKASAVPAKSDPVPAKSDPVPAKSDPVPAKSDPVPAKSDPVPAAAKKGGADMPVADKERPPETTVPAMPPSTTAEQPPSTPVEAADKGPSAEKVNGLVDEYRTLPRSNQTSNDPLLKDLYLSSDTSQAKSSRIKLALHGFPSANQWLSKRLGGQLTAEPQGDALLVRVQAGGTETALAKFTAGEDNVSFQWFAFSDGHPPSSDCYAALKRCVLEAAGDSKSTFVSLSKPIVTDQLTFKAGTLTLDLRQLGAADLEPSGDDELLLAYGSIEVENGRRLPFGDAASPGVRANLRDLPGHYKKTAAQVELTRAVRDPESRWLVRIAAGDEPNGKDENRPPRLSLKLLREKMQACNSNDLNGVDAAVRILAADLKVSAPVVPARDQRNKDSVNNYRNAIKKDILPPAKERESQLQQIEQLRDHALKMSAVIYRRVTPTMFARYLTIGHPEPPVVDQPKDDEKADDDKKADKQADDKKTEDADEDKPRMTNDE